MTYRTRIVGILVIVLTVTVVASGGFSATGLDRGVNIQVVDNEQAMIGVKACALPDLLAENQTAGSGHASGTPVSIDVTNRVGGDITVDEIISEHAIVNDHSELPKTTAPFTVVFSGPPDELTVVVSANGMVTRITVDVVRDGRCPIDTAGDNAERSGDIEAGNDGDHRET